jgi:hypothetical protein
MCVYTTYPYKHAHRHTHAHRLLRIWSVEAKRDWVGPFIYSFRPSPTFVVLWEHLHWGCC